MNYDVKESAVRLSERIEWVLLENDNDITTLYDEFRVQGIIQKPCTAEYKCYKIKGHVEEWKTENSAKTDWIFFRTGMYKELEVGDKIRFKISKTEVKNWNDIGLARNIYPADLVIEE